MLDTNVCITLMRKGSRRIETRMKRHAIEDIGVSAISLAELQYGVDKSLRPAHHQGQLDEFCAPLAVLPFNVEAAASYGRVRAALERDGSPIGALDTMIASHARALDLILVTRNCREFRRVNGLRVEDWTQ